MVSILPLLWLFAPCSHGAPVIEDRGDAYYLDDTRREDLARAWFRAQMDAEPDEAMWLILYLRTLGQSPTRRLPALAEVVRRWVSEHPQAEAGTVAVALAEGLAAIPSNQWRSSPYPEEAGPWCEKVAAALATLPADAEARYLVYRERMQVPEVCGLDVEEAKAQAEALALSGHAGDSRRAWFGYRDGVDQDDVDALRRALDEEPWRLGAFTPYFSKKLDAEAAAPARALLLARARALADSDRPAHVEGAARILAASPHKEEARAAYQRLQGLDPDNQNIQWALRALDDRDRPHPPGAETVRPTTILEPAARLAALQEARPPANRWDRLTYWTARADAAGLTGDVEEQLDALHHAVRLSPSWKPNLAFARVAIAHGTRMREAGRTLRWARAWVERAPRADADAEAWRKDFAEVLDVQSQWHEARGHDRKAVEALERAVALSPAPPDRQRRLGLLYARLGEGPLASRLLAEALARGDDLASVDRREATKVLAKQLDDGGVWRPRGVHGWIAATRKALGEATPAPAVLDNRRFEDLTFRVGGRSSRIFDYEGPVVVDIWATWCRPCTESLPHLEQLARTYPDIQFIAVSVDREQDTAQAYLAERGTVSFVTGWAGADGMTTLGISGIPKMYVFDTDHALVEVLGGWGPGSTALDEAIERMLAR